jgi:hypothetical protein
MRGFVVSCERRRRDDAFERLSRRRKFVFDDNRSGTAGASAATGFGALSDFNPPH